MVKITQFKWFIAFYSFFQVIFKKNSKGFYLKNSILIFKLISASFNQDVDLNVVRLLVKVDTILTAPGLDYRLQNTFVSSGMNAFSCHYHQASCFSAADHFCFYLLIAYIVYEIPMLNSSLIILVMASSKSSIYSSR